MSMLASKRNGLNRLASKPQGSWDGNTHKTETQLSVDKYLIGSSMVRDSQVSIALFLKRCIYIQKLQFLGWIAVSCLYFYRLIMNINPFRFLRHFFLLIMRIPRYTEGSVTMSAEPKGTGKFQFIMSLYADLNVFIKELYKRWNTAVCLSSLCEKDTKPSVLSFSNFTSQLVNIMIPFYKLKSPMVSLQQIKQAKCNYITSILPQNPCNKAIIQNISHIYKIFVFLWVLPLKAGRLHENFVGVEPLETDYSILACTKDPMTHILEIKVHAQRVVVDAIQDVENEKHPEMLLDPKATATRYFGAVFDSINDDSLPRKVQFHMNLDALITEDFIPNLTVDFSCEKTDPISEKTIEATNLLREKYNGSIGLHLFIWSCPMALPAGKSTYYIENNEHCGRVMGILWQGTDITIDKIIDLIYDAFNMQTGYPEGAENADNQICNYVNRCLARNLTDLGQKVAGIHHLKYTSDFSFTDFD